MARHRYICDHLEHSATGSTQFTQHTRPSRTASMLSNKTLIIATALLLLLLPTQIHASPVKRELNTKVQGVLGTDEFWNDYDGGKNHYTMYTGNGSIAAGWPSVNQWISFNQMWTINQRILQRSCDGYYKSPNNSPEELTDLYYAIQQVAQETRVDHRFILAAIMQETKGCVRAITSKSQDGIHNPGLLQDFKGTHTCNDDGKSLTPCPKEQIVGMIRDGVAGTDEGHGFAEDINMQQNYTNIEFAQAYYRAARFYNSGMIDTSGDLGKGTATHCYATDIANRLTGWVDAPTNCTLDKDNKNAHQ